MKAKDAVVGQFYQDVQWGRALSCGTVNPQTTLHAFAIRQGASTVMRYFGDNREIEHLPGCTGWDWQPTAPLSIHGPIPDGWRIVSENEAIAKGDKYWHGDYWCLSGGHGRATHCTYIRRIEPQLPDPGEGWRHASGDDYKDDRCQIWIQLPHSKGFWTVRDYPGESFVEGSIYRVPVAPQYRAFAGWGEVLPFWKEPVFDKATGTPKAVVSAGAGGITIGNHSMSYGVAFDEYQHKDGTPFGVKVQ